MRYTVLKPKFEKIDIGSMNHRIGLYTRDIAFVANQGNYITPHEEELTKILDVWAAMETVSGLTIFDGTRTEYDISHNIYIRYRSDITFENWILYESNYYRILNVEDLQQEHKFLKLQINIRGDQSLAVNKA